MGSGTSDRRNWSGRKNDRGGLAGKEVTPRGRESGPPASRTCGEIVPFLAIGLPTRSRAFQRGRRLPELVNLRGEALSLTPHTGWGGRYCKQATRSFTSAYSRLSTSACRLGSMMFSFTPTVPHSE